MSVFWGLRQDWWLGQYAVAVLLQRWNIMARPYGRTDAGIVNYGDQTINGVPTGFWQLKGNGHPYFSEQACQLLTQ